MNHQSLRSEAAVRPAAIQAPALAVVVGEADLRVAAQLVAGSVLLAAVKGRPADLSANYCLFIALGLDVDYGKNRWE